MPLALDGVDLGDDLLEIGAGPGRTTDLLRGRVDAADRGRARRRPRRAARDAPRRDQRRRRARRRDRAAAAGGSLLARRSRSRCCTTCRPPSSRTGSSPSSRAWSRRAAPSCSPTACTATRSPTSTSTTPTTRSTPRTLRRAARRGRTHRRHRRRERRALRRPTPAALSRADSAERLARDLAEGLDALGDRSRWPGADIVMPSAPSATISRQASADLVRVAEDHHRLDHRAEVVVGVAQVDVAQRERVGELVEGLLVRRCEHRRSGAGSP